MITYYNPRPGHSEWMRSLPVIVADRNERKGGFAETQVTPEMLQRAIKAYGDGKTLHEISDGLGVTYHALHHQMKKHGGMKTGKERTVSPPLEDVEPFVEWLRSNGIQCKKNKGVRLYNVRLTNQTRFILLVEGKIKLGPGLNYRYADFCRERESAGLQS